MTAPHFEPVVPDRFTTGECPTWDATTGQLLWTSIDDGDIHALNPVTGLRQVWHFDSTVGSFGLCHSGRLVVALRDAVVLFDRDTNKITPLASLPMPVARARLNDGKVGPDGAFWVGSMDERVAKQPIGALYRVDGRGDVRILTHGLLVSNGLAWSPDGTVLYHSDSRGPWVDQWEFDPDSGEAGNRRRFLDLDDATGRPDGAAMDTAGCYWSAGPSAGRINRFNPDGQLIEKLEVPNLRPTMPCFGGSDLRTLFITSLTASVDPHIIERNPLIGTIVATQVAVTGTPTHLFAD